MALYFLYLDLHDGKFFSRPQQMGEKRKGSFKPQRDHSVEPSKVNTTWEEQCKLAGKLRDMGVSCKACLRTRAFSPQIPRQGGHVLQVQSDRATY